ncbi:type III secretion system inner rod subunit SctI [Erwiniaceae bacterium BAC15a-03b]|uniref:Type III secretion system inner rod subunit SctI n=1 Tax=Winslowiella arboricola TaxID=2978220 RepID=A0A9J6PPP8_9GAMM|nr:type III secretion system inner rod subunit SctI [Winslowiella arboricola]MCU5773751.1 type III secretion system inner rod subunit SctI [Winslowiella arboricola]MCU5777661.1 type III secretion system inner rod subunit SctI [Winslowiella arboricola]
MLPVSPEMITVSSSADNDINNHTLEGLLREAYTRHVAAEYQEKLEVLQSASDPVNATDIETIYQYQLKTSEYNLKLSLYSTLTRKAVTAVDTLIRA